MSTIRDIIGCVFIAIGVILYVIEIIGVYRFDFILNRMHATAIGDSLGLLSVFIGAAILMWDIFACLKLLVLIIAVYITSPISSHLISRVEALTNNHFESYLDRTIKEKKHTLKG